MKWPDKSPKLLNVFKSDSEHEQGNIHYSSTQNTNENKFKLKFMVFTIVALATA